MVAWQRKRNPQDVPTPVAIALSDFCRRAGAPGSAELVRDALAVLPASDDARVRALAGGEPPARPLGPFAVVDLLSGTPAELAASRERTGYYDLVRLVMKDPSPPPGRSAPRPRATPAPLPMAKASAPPPRKSPRRRKDRAAQVALQDRIAPKKRRAGAAPPLRATPPPPPEPKAAYKKRELPLPRGRFSTLTGPRFKVEALLEARAKPELSGLVDSCETRHGVLKAVAPHYATRGKPPDLADVERALAHHGLLEQLAAKERTGLVAALGAARGAWDRAARTLGVPGRAELQALAKSLKVDRELRELRDRFVRDALDPANLPHRLELFGRERYLVDLGLARKFPDALARDLRGLLERHHPARPADVARLNGLNVELFERAATRLGLIDRSSTLTT